MARFLPKSQPAQKKIFKFGIQWKITLMIAVAASVVVAFILGYVLPQWENSLYEAKKAETQNHVITAWTTLQYYGDLEKQGTLTREEAQIQAKAAINALRYGPDMKEYFYVFDFKPVMLVHPYSAKLVGTDVSGLKDPTNKLFIQEQLQIAKTQKEGFSTYMWQYKDDASRIVPKTTYVKTFEPWNWVVASGVYTVDIAEKTDSLRFSLTLITLIMVLASIGICFWLAGIWFAKPLKKLVAVGKAVAVGDVEQDVQVKSGDEVGEVTQAFADMVAYMKEMSAAANQLSEGNLNVEIKAKSEKDELSKSFAGVASTLSSLMGEIMILTIAGTEGNLQLRGDVSKFKGDYASIVQGINDTLDAVIGPLNMAAEYIDNIAKGSTPSRITDEYKGDYNIIKNNLNKCINALSTLVDQTGVVIGAAKEGKLEVRADAEKAEGVYRKILRGFNETLNLVVVPINESRGVLAREADNDLTTHVSGDYRGDFCQLKDAINSSLDNRINVVLKLREVSRDLAGASKQLNMAAEQSSDATQQIATSSQQVAKGAADQASGLQETLKAVEQLSNAIDQIANGAQEQAQMIEKNVQVVSQISTAINQVSGNAQNASTGARVAAESAQKGAAMSRETVKGMENIKKTMDVVSAKVNGLGDRSKEIGKIVAAIDDIADQTNLLALNAAVEAARAGEQGRGFAVVADEVRKLAERSQLATKEIADLIGGIQGGVAEAVTAMEKGTKEVDGGYELATKAGQSLDEILENSKDMGTQVEQISSAAQQLTAMSTEMVKLSDSISAIVEENTASTAEMAITAKEVSRSVESVAGVAEENSAASEQVSAAAEEISAQVQQVVASGTTLTNMANDFEGLIARYKLNGNGHTPESVAVGAAPAGNKSRNN